MTLLSPINIIKNYNTMDFYHSSDWYIAITLVDALNPLRLLKVIARHSVVYLSQADIASLKFQNVYHRFNTFYSR